jgi:hypothetical protein
LAVDKLVTDSVTLGTGGSACCVDFTEHGAAASCPNCFTERVRVALVDGRGELPGRCLVRRRRRRLAAVTKPYYPKWTRKDRVSSHQSGVPIPHRRWTRIVEDLVLCERAPQPLAPHLLEARP